MCFLESKINFYFSIDFFLTIDHIELSKTRKFPLGRQVPSPSAAEEDNVVESIQVFSLQNFGIMDGQTDVEFEIVF